MLYNVHVCNNDVIRCLTFELITIPMYRGMQRQELGLVVFFMVDCERIRSQCTTISNSHHRTMKGHSHLSIQRFTEKYTDWYIVMSPFLWLSEQATRSTDLPHLIKSIL